LKPVNFVHYGVFNVRPTGRGISVVL